MIYETINFHRAGPVAYLQFDRPAAGNTINRAMIEECHDALDACLAGEAAVLVMRGSDETFCAGADFDELSRSRDGEDHAEAERLYRLWTRLTEEPFVTVSHVQGKAAAGGMGFVAASDIVIADPAASFALSELLFGLFPACVLPFLTRRIGFQKAHYMTVTTRPVPADIAASWGLVDECAPNSQDLLRKQLLRLGRLSRTAVGRYKRYSAAMHGGIQEWAPRAIEANRALFLDPANRLTIRDFVEHGKFPWETGRQ